MHATTAPANATDKKLAVARLFLVLLALLGIVVAATTAAFTDNAWFSASASSASVELQGRVGVADGEEANAWEDADTTDSAITIPASAFSNMVPGETRTVSIELRNAGSVDLAVAAPTITATGALVEQSTITTDFQPKTLAAEGTGTVVVTITAGEWGADLQGSTDGAITISFSGTTVAS